MTEWEEFIEKQKMSLKAPICKEGSRNLLENPENYGILCYVLEDKVNSP